MGPTRRLRNGIRAAAAVAGVMGLVGAAGCGRSGPSALQDQVDYAAATNLFRAPLPGSLATLPQDPNTPVAVVDGQPIRMGQWQQAVQLQLMRLRGRVSAEELARLAPRLRQDALQGLIAQLLLRHEVEEAGIEVAEEALDAHLAQLREGMPEGQDWADALRRAGATEESVREQVRAQLRVEELVRTRLPEVEPPAEEEIRAFFDANAERLAQPELVDVRLLVLRIPDDADEAGREAVRQQARRLKEDAEAGASFEALVAEHSQDPRTRETGGLVAGLPRTTLPEALFDADPGTIGEPIESPSAVQLARVEQRTPGRPRTLEEVHDQVASLLTEQRRQAALRQYIAELSADANIQILVGETAPPTPPTPPAP